MVAVQWEDGCHGHMGVILQPTKSDHGGCFYTILVTKTGRLFTQHTKATSKGNVPPGS